MSEVGTLFRRSTVVAKFARHLKPEEMLLVDLTYPFPVRRIVLDRVTYINGSLKHPPNPVNVHGTTELGSRWANQFNPDLRVFVVVALFRIAAVTP